MESINIQKNGILANMDNAEYIRFMESKGYKREKLHIDETSEIVTATNLTKGNVGKVVDIRCPSRYKIFILGRNQLPKNITDDVHLHTLALGLADNNNNEISPDTRIRISKEKPSLEMMLLTTMLYKDITKTDYFKILPNGIKPNNKLYKFNNSIQLNGEEHLNIDVIQPDLDIYNSSTELYLEIDLWEES